MKLAMFWKLVKVAWPPLVGVLGTYLAISNPSIYQAFCSGGL